jgi:hypothetical protein
MDITGILISDTERDALARIAYAEARQIRSADPTLRYGSVVDSIINRVASDSGQFGRNVIEVIMKSSQYEPISKVRARLDDEGLVRDKAQDWRFLDGPPGDVVAIVNQQA